jgi:hypothetical protein
MRGSRIEDADRGGEGVVVLDLDVHGDAGVAGQVVGPAGPGLDEHGRGVGALDVDEEALRVAGPAALHADGADVAAGLGGEGRPAQAAAAGAEAVDFGAAGGKIGEVDGEGERHAVGIADGDVEVERFADADRLVVEGGDLERRGARAAEAGEQEQGAGNRRPFHLSFLPCGEARRPRGAGSISDATGECKSAGVDRVPSGL